MFFDKNLSLSINRCVYNACFLSVLLHAAECWTPLMKHYRKLNTFHHKYIRIILGISNRQQCSQHITMAEVRRRWGDTMTVTCRVKLKRLELLGHLVMMSNSRLLKRVFFGWFPQPRPRCGARRRWKDVIKKDLVHIVDKDNWYETARSRTVWRSMCIDDVEDEVMYVHRPLVNQTVCAKYVIELLVMKVIRRDTNVWMKRRKPISEQKGAVQCPHWLKWLKAREERSSIHVYQEIDVS